MEIDVDTLAAVGVDMTNFRLILTILTRLVTVELIGKPLGVGRRRA
jgi:hypothetical protein